MKDEIERSENKEYQKSLLSWGNCDHQEKTRKVYILDKRSKTLNDRNK